MTKHDAHIYMDDYLWTQVVNAARDSDRSVTAMCRILIKEGLAHRGLNKKHKRASHPGAAEAEK